MQKDEIFETYFIASQDAHTGHFVSLIEQDSEPGLGIRAFTLHLPSTDIHLYLLGTPIGFYALI